MSYRKRQYLTLMQACAIQPNSWLVALFYDPAYNSGVGLLAIRNTLRTRGYTDGTI